MQEEWHCNLNTLVQMGVIQGVFGVLQALAYVGTHAKEFFAFAPSLNLYRPGDTQHWCEIDLACIVDGQFLIGEVKEGIIQEAAISKLVEVARTVQPDRLAIFLPEEVSQKQTAELQKWIATANHSLLENGITLELFELPQF
jgi:hypothetical protein